MSRLLNEKEIKYHSYILEHTTNVGNAYYWLYKNKIITDENNEINNLIIAHDESKFSKYEFSQYANYFYGEKTEKVKEDFDYAWLHHIHNNPHHWQYWVLINDDDGTKALEMPYEYVIEMICDWWSFSFKQGNLKEIFNWYENHKAKMILHENTRKLVEEILGRIKEKLWWLLFQFGYLSFYQ